MTTIHHITTEQFLEALFGSSEAPIYFNTNGKSWKYTPCTYIDAKPKLEYCNTLQKCDIYFIPNSGGTQNCQITGINALFIDWDAGRDSNRQYFSLDIVQQKKQEFLQILAQFKYKPSFVVATRNGYHVYWLVYPGCTPATFIVLQKALIAYFHSDPQVHNPARVMRLPGYYASKSGNYSPFFISIIESSDTRYSVDIFTDFFGIQSVLPEPSFPQQNEQTRGRFGAHNNIYINKEYTGSIIMGTFPQKARDWDKPITVDTMEEAVDYICRQDIVSYYNPDQRCNPPEGMTTTCPFHQDKTPSASVYFNNGYCYLKCHSQNCSFGSGTLIKIVQKKENLTEGQAAKTLIKHYNIILDESWKENEKKKIEENLEVLKNIDVWHEQYPHLYCWISRVIWDLRSKLTYAQSHIKLRTSQGKGIFFCSLTHFEKIYRRLERVKSQNNQNQRVDRYCLLGLLEKVHESEIPYGLYRQTQKIKGDRRHLYRMQYYHIPMYTPELLLKAEQIARTGKARGVRLNAITKNSIRDIYGEEVAKLIYPQTEDITLSKSATCLWHSMEQVIHEQIAQKGYTCTTDIIAHLSGIATWQSIHERRVKALLPGIMEKLSLEEKYTTKDMKEKFRLNTKGYPKIIVRSKQ